jgi:translation initiation factor IF-1
VTEDSKGTKPKQQPGVVEEVLPKALFLVRLEDGRRVRANVSSSLRHAIVRLIAGDRVSVELSHHDPNRGRITKKH